MTTMPEQTTRTDITEATVRRVPKYGVFLVLGGAVGVLAAAVLTFTFDGVADASEIGVTYSRGQVFGFLTLYCIAGGVALAAIVALILDKVVGRKRHTVTVEHEIVADED